MCAAIVLVSLIDESESLRSPGFHFGHKRRRKRFSPPSPGRPRSVDAKRQGASGGVPTSPFRFLNEICTTAFE